MRKLFSSLIFFFKEWFRPMPGDKNTYYKVKEDAQREKDALYHRFRKNPMAEEARQNPDDAGRIATDGDNAMSGLLEDASGGDSTGSCTHKTR